MGVWGMGPFDSDSGLDLLADLARTAGAQTRDDDAGAPAVVPGTADQQAVTAELTAVFTFAVRSIEAGEYRDRSEIYAAAGLVAAAVTGTSPEPRGTSLFTGEGGLGLERHSGYLTLLEPDTAERLRPHAQAAVAALRVDLPWLRDWRDSGEIRMQLRNLETALDGAGTPARPHVSS